MSTGSARNGKPTGVRGIVAVLSCVAGLGLVFFGFGVSMRSPKQEATASGTPEAQTQKKKPARAWNMALGNVVIVAQDLGFGVKSAKDDIADPSKFAARIDSQLQSLREIYRVEGEKNPALMGGIMLQFSVNPSGEVSQVKEIASRIPDGEFKKAVASEISKWSFQDIVAENVTVNCPLLFVREGMDITTLVQWEKSLGQFGDKSTLARGNTSGSAIQQFKAVETSNRAMAASTSAAAVPEKPALASAAKALPGGYQIKYATSVRKEPNFSAAAVGKFTIGTKVSIIDNRGEWLEVRADGTNSSGFIRKEFVVPIEIAHK
jgi:hypothetical protein